jgi:hypothetical protein
MTPAKPVEARDFRPVNRRAPEERADFFRPLGVREGAK